MGQILGCVKVKESNVGIKEVFDKYDDVLQPGCHYVPWYFGHHVAANISLGFKLFYVPIQAKTKDNVVVTVNAYFQFRVLQEMVVEAHYKFGNHATHISRYVADAVMALVAKMNLDSVYQDRTEIATAVQKQIGKEMSASGFEIVKITLEIKLDETVKKAMNDAVKLRVETKEKAEAEKMLQLKRAESAAETKYLTGLGMARQFQAIADGVNGNKLAFPENVPNDATAATSSKDIMEMVLVNQYLDTIKEITASANTNAVFNGNVAVSQMKDGLALVQGNVAAAKDAVSQLKNAAAKGNAATAKGAASLVKNAPLQIK